MNQNELDAHRSAGEAGTARLLSRARSMRGAGHISAPLTQDQTALVFVRPTLLSRLEPRDRVVLATGMILARLKLGDIGAAEELSAAERERNAVGMPGIDAADVAAFWVAVAAVCALGGRPRDAGEAAGRALAVAPADSAERRDAASLLALSTAMNGEYRRARERVHAARRIAAGSQASLASAIADGLIAAAEGDLFRLRVAVGELESMPSEWARAAASAMTGRAAIMAGTPGDALGSCSDLVAGVTSGGLPALLRLLGVESVAAAHLVRGDFRRALVMLREESSDASHVVCVEGARAAAHLALNDPAAALRASDGCVRSGRAHSLRTLPPTLLVRAAAFARVGDAEAALLTIEEAVQIVLGAGGSILPPLGASAAELQPLLEQLQLRSPHLRPTLSYVARVLASMAPPSRAQVLPALTRRERDIAWALTDHGTMVSIAGALGVSVNTVKTQLRQLYAKLGVSSRAEASTKLRQSGFYTDDRPNDPGAESRGRIAMVG